MRSRYDGGSTSAFLSQADPRKLPLPDPMSGSTTFLPLTPAHSGWLGLREMGLRRAVPRFFDEPDGVFWSPPSQALKRFCLQFRGRYEEFSSSCLTCFESCRTSRKPCSECELTGTA